MLKYRYPLSPLVIGCTIACYLLVMVVGCSVSWYLAVVLVLRLSLPLFYMPLRFEEDDNEYRIVFLVHTRHFRKEEWQLINFNNKLLMRSLRTFGSGLLWGLLGYFWHKEVGNYQAFVTNQKSPMLMLQHRARKERVVTPLPSFMNDRF